MACQTPHNTVRLNRTNAADAAEWRAGNQHKGIQKGARPPTSSDKGVGDDIGQFSAPRLGLGAVPAVLDLYLGVHGRDCYRGGGAPKNLKRTNSSVRLVGQPAATFGVRPAQRINKVWKHGGPSVALRMIRRRFSRKTNKGRERSLGGSLEADLRLGRHASLTS